MKEFGRRIWWCNFSTLIHIVAETTIVSFHTLPVWFSHSQQSPRILCTRCFVPWFLTTAFFSKFPFLFPKFLFRISCSILLFTIFFQSSDESPSQTIPIRSWVSQDSRILNLYDPSKMSSCGILVMDNRIPSHLESNSWISSFRRTIVHRSV